MACGKVTRTVTENVYMETLLPLPLSSVSRPAFAEDETGLVQNRTKMPLRLCPLDAGYFSGSERVPPLYALLFRFALPA